MSDRLESEGDWLEPLLMPPFPFIELCYPYKTKSVNILLHFFPGRRAPIVINTLNKMQINFRIIFEFKKYASSSVTVMLV